MDVIALTKRVADLESLLIAQRVMQTPNLDYAMKEFSFAMAQSELKYRVVFQPINNGEWKVRSTRVAVERIVLEGRDEKEDVLGLVRNAVEAIRKFTTDATPYDVVYFRMKYIPSFDSYQELVHTTIAVLLTYYQC